MTVQKKNWRDSTWVVVLCCFMMLFTGLGFCSSPKGFYLDEVTKVMGVSRSAFSLNDTIRYLITAVLSLYFSALVKALGTKKLIVVGFGLLIGSQLISAWAPNVMIYWIGGGLLGAGLSLMGNAMVSYVINRRVKKNKGTILGFVMAANGLGGAIAIPLISWCIENTAGGYKTAYYVVSAILTVVALMVCLLFREDDSQPHEGPAKKKARGNAWEGVSYEQGKKTPVFYLACILSFFTAFILAGINGISKAHCRDVGFSNEVLAGIWSCHSLALMGGKFFFGVIYDRKGLRWTLITAQAASVIVLMALGLAAMTPFGTAMVWTYSIFSAVAIPLETIGVSLVAGDLFGSRDYAKFLGILTAVNSAGFALGNPGLNLVYDIAGTYRPGIFAGAGMMVLVAIAFQFTVTKAYKAREEITSKGV